VSAMYSDGTLMYFSNKKEKKKKKKKKRKEMRVLVTHSFHPSNEYKNI
jgi:hypothetical protein